MAARRQDRINEEVARELTSILRTVKVARRVSGAFLSVTGADVSRDLSLARVYYSILGEAEGAGRGAVQRGGLYPLGAGRAAESAGRAPSSFPYATTAPRER